MSEATILEAPAAEQTAIEPKPLVNLGDIWAKITQEESGNPAPPAPEPPKPKAEPQPQPAPEPPKPKVETPAPKPFDFTPPKPAEEVKVEPPKPQPEQVESKSPKVREQFKALEAARDAEANKAATLEAKLKEIERQLNEAKRKGVDSEQLEALRRDNEELERRIAAVDVQQSLEFQRNFGTRDKMLTEQIKSAAGPEAGDRLLALLKMPDTQDRVNLLTQILGEMPTWQQTKIMVLADQFDKLNAEKEAVLSDPIKSRNELYASREAKEKVQKEMIRREFDRAVSMAQGPENGLEVLSLKEGDEAHNATVREAIEQARGVFEGKFEPEDMARAALWAVSAPLYRKAVFAQKALIAKYEEQIKAMQASRPTVQGKAAGTQEPPRDENPFVARLRDFSA